jgi:hypothetical protein
MIGTTQRQKHSSNNNEWLKSKNKQQTLKENQTSGYHGLGTHRSSQRSAWLRRNEGTMDRAIAHELQTLPSSLCAMAGRPSSSLPSLQMILDLGFAPWCVYISPWMGILHRRFHIDGWKLFSIKPYFRVSSPRYFYRCLKMQRWTRLHPSISILQQILKILKIPKIATIAYNMKAC